LEEARRLAAIDASIKRNKTCIRYKKQESSDDDDEEESHHYDNDSDR
jgi:hypothetical protein